MVGLSPTSHVFIDLSKKAVDVDLRRHDDDRTTGGSIMTTLV
jgi:hypothetical protein